MIRLPATRVRLATIATTATVLAALRWREDAHLLLLGVLAFAFGLFGYRARRRAHPGWPPRHAIGMGGSYILLLTAFYVDNGPHLPLWDRLPTLAFWLLPSAIGAPIIARAIIRARRFPRSAAPPSGQQPPNPSR